LDRTILTLSGGALALSITFVNQIAPQPISVWILLVAWSLFALSLLLTLLSFWFSQHAIERALHLHTANYQGTQQENSSNRYSAVTQNLNICSVLSFILAVVFLISFAFLNVIK
jgi:hypothetical protein